jgi:hypothetical protein
LHRRQQESMAWSPGQVIVNSTGAKVPRHQLNRPIPVLARILWDRATAKNGSRQKHSAGPAGRCNVRMPDRRYRFTSVWLDASDVERR